MSYKTALKYQDQIAEDLAVDCSLMSFEGQVKFGYFGMGYYWIVRHANHSKGRSSMNNAAKTGAAFVLIALLAGCATPSKVMRSWEGHNVSDLYMNWGPPTSTTSDGKSGQIVSYYYNRNFGQVPGRAVRNSDGSVSYTAPTNSGYTAARHFFVDKNGVIYAWRWSGL